MALKGFQTLFTGTTGSTTTRGVAGGCGGFDSAIRRDLDLPIDKYYKITQLDNLQFGNDFFAELHGGGLLVVADGDQGTGSGGSKFEWQVDFQFASPI